MNPYEPRTTIVKPALGLAIRATVPLAELPAFFGGAFVELDTALRRSGAAPAGPPFARYHGAPPAPIDVELVMPIATEVAPPPATGRVRIVHVAGGAAVETLHVGPYDAMAGAYAAIARFLEDHGLEAADAPREIYLTGPGDVADASQHRTLVVQMTRPRPAQAVSAGDAAS